MVLQAISLNERAATVLRTMPFEQKDNGVLEVSSMWVSRHSEECHIVDVRDLDDFLGEQGHVPGAELVPVAALEQLSQEWEVTKPVVLISETGATGVEAARMLAAMDIPCVVNMKGGMKAWHQHNLPVTHSW